MYNGYTGFCTKEITMNMSKKPLRDEEGYLIQPDDWTEHIANELAKEEGLELNETYWQALNFMQSYYNEHNVAPDVRHLISHMAVANSCSKREAKKLVFNLFPYGYVKQACKIAGMKRPRAWSTG